MAEVVVVDSSKAEKVKEVQFNSHQLKRQRKHNRTLSESSYFSSFSTASGASESSKSFYSIRSPDGGWGWCVVIASFFVNMIADGITFSFGLIFLELQEEFKQSKAVTSIVVSLFHSVPLISGPISSALTDRYGCRRVTIFGSILATIGFLLTSLAESLTLIYFTCGILSGFGLSLCYVAALVIVAYYFDSKRSLATGISVCGSGVGTFFFGPFIDLLIKYYEWRGTMVILAGFLLNMCVCAMVFRDLEWTKTIREKQVAPTSPARTSMENVSKTSTEKMPEINDLKALLETGDVSALFEDSSSVNDSKRISSSLVQIPTYLKHSDLRSENQTKLNVKVISPRTNEGARRTSVKNNRRSHLSQGLSASEQQRVSKSNPKKCPLPVRRVSTLFRTSDEEHSKPILKRRVTDSENPPVQEHLLSKARESNLTASKKDQHLNHLKMRRSSLTYRGAMLSISRYRLRASNSCPDIYKNSMIGLSVNSAPCPNQRMSSLLNCFHTFSCCKWSKFLHPPFCLFLLSNFVLYAWYDTMYTYFPDYLEKTLNWTPTNSACMVSVIGVFNTIGEVFVGYFGDKTWLNRNFLYAGCMVACGVVTAIVPFITNDMFLRFTAAVFGFAISANYSLTSPILVDLVSIEEFSNAYGLLLLVQGLSNLFGPPFAGWLHDLTHEWYLTFTLAGGFIALSGALVVVLPLLKLFSSNNKSEEVEAGGADGFVNHANEVRKPTDSTTA